MSGIWFVTPAWKRYELSAVCFDQRRLVIDALAEAGVEAHCVVVADDANLELARARGFATVERDNRWLGRKFNDGMEYAGRHGADWIVPIGSDSWIDPAYFLPLPEAGETRTSGAYCAVTATRLAELRVGRRGAGPYMFPAALLEPSGFRPAGDRLERYIDHATVRGIGPRRIQWVDRTIHPFQYVGFRGTPHLTSYARLMETWGVREHLDPWRLLATCYPADLVARAKDTLLARVAA